MCPPGFSDLPTALYYIIAVGRGGTGWHQPHPRPLHWELRKVNKKKNNIILLIFLVISNLLWPFSTHLLFFLHTPFLMKVCGKILFTADYHILTVSKCLYLYKRSKIVLHYTSKIHYSTVYIKTKKNHFTFPDRPNALNQIPRITHII